MHLRSISSLTSFIAVISVVASGCGPASDSEVESGVTSPIPTLRVDYVHTGTADTESFELDELIVEGDWPGPLDKTLDPLGYGEYFFEVTDAETGQKLYSRGFASIFGEWQTTSEAKEIEGSFHESLRFPMPEGPVVMTVMHRQPDMSFKEVWTVEIDPSQAVVRNPNQDFRVWSVIENGPPSEKVDLLLLGDGYTAEEMEKWRADARRMAESLFEHSPFRERRSDFNVWAIDTPVPESGVSRPSVGVERESPIGASYDAFGSERYILTFDNKQWRDVAAAAPYEYVEIIVNERKYGGGGIYNLFATVAADNAFTPYVFVHEFGHHFAGLADEYYTSSVAYESSEERIEPWGPNATANPTSPKWADLIEEGTPLPTPWPKAEFEEFQRTNQQRRRELRAAEAPEEEVEALFDHEREFTSALLSGSPHADKVGAFEGAHYEATGYYRSQADCIMFTRNKVPFCAACTRAINRMIDLYSAHAGD
jgi:hypothetical protein